MLTLLVPILINYLLEGDELQQATKYQASLHQQSFQWLNKIGPKYPQVYFENILESQVHTYTHTQYTIIYYIIIVIYTVRNLRR